VNKTMNKLPGQRFLATRWLCAASRRTDPSRGQGKRIVEVRGCVCPSKTPRYCIEEVWWLQGIRLTEINKLSQSSEGKAAGVMKYRRVVSITHSFLMRSSLSTVPDDATVTKSKPAITEIPVDQIRFSRSAHAMYSGVKKKAHNTSLTP
jgi:hypothetical protein